ncbi:MAG: DNA polymerase domain-containing protein, partial [Candidatus Thermoplasmatota archaeon]|nr:DNA polymerase domain-containing protein [Candidatus Thermoplasmatota archaeon]
LDIVTWFDDVKEKLSKDPMVRSLDERTLWYKGKDRRCTKVTIKYPFKVPAYRNYYKERGYDVLAADIPFIFRYFYDMDLGTFIEVEGEQVLDEDYSTDIVLSVRDVASCEPFKQRLKVLSFDIENSIRSGELYMVGISVAWLPLKDGEGTNNFSILPPPDIDDPGEREDLMIEGLEKAVKEHDPDIITGYNIDGYDIPHILKRAKLLSIEGLSMGRDGSNIDSKGYRSWRSRGRIIVDAWWQAKKTFRPKKETLESVATLLLGEGKDDIDTSIIEEEWANRREDVIKYCLKDAELALRILDRTMAIKKSIDLAYVAKLPLTDVLSGTTSNLIDSILIREADTRNIGIPLTRHEKKTSKIEGAYVHSIKPGIYHKVVVLDFRSMYPSLMIDKNICFTTLTDEEDDTIHSPLPGVNFLRPERKKGLLPEILKKLMDERQQAKRSMKEADTEEDIGYYNGLQEALKVLMNSFYGVFASFFYRFTDRSIGSSITAYARESIMGIIDTLVSEELDVIYSDTDSIFIRSPYDDMDGTIAFGKELSSRFSSGAQVLEFEKVFDSFFTHGKKKRYVGKVVWPTEKMVVRGYEMRRTDSFDLQSETLEKMFELLLDDQEDRATDLAKETIKDLREGKVPVEKLVISRSIQEVEEEKIVRKYKNPDSMANVQALRKARKHGLELVPGMKVSWIVTDARVKPQRVEPYIDGRDFEHGPDLQYYSERLSSTLSRVTEVFGISEKELLSGIQQTSLFDPFDGDRDTDDRPMDDEDEMQGGISQKKDNGPKQKVTTTLDKWM